MTKKKITTIFLLTLLYSALQSSDDENSELAQQAAESIETVRSYLMGYIMPNLISYEDMHHDKELEMLLASKIAAEEKRVAMYSGRDAAEFIFLSNMFESVKKNVDERYLRGFAARQEMDELLARLKSCQERCNLIDLLHISCDVQGRIEKRKMGSFSPVDSVVVNQDDEIDALEKRLANLYK